MNTFCKLVILAVALTAIEKAVYAVCAANMPSEPAKKPAK